MGNQGHTSPGEFRKPLHEVLPDRRLRTTRYIALTSGDKIRDAQILAWGTVDAGPNTGVHALWSGLRLIRQSVAELDGSNYIVRVYETIPATAEIQVGSNTRISLEDGRESIEAEFLQFSAGTYAPGSVGSTTAPGDTNAFLQRAEQTNDGTLRRIKRTYVYAGQIAQSDNYGEQNKSLLRTITNVKTVPSTPSGYTLIATDVNPVNGLPIYRYTFAKGEGLVSVSIAMRNDGLREETNVSYGTKTTPTGIVIRDDYREGNGYRIYTVTAMQAADGTTATGATYSIEAYVPFTYPGRAKAFSETYDGKVMLNLFKDPPVATEVRATVTVSYQTSNVLGTISDYWNPSQWACVRAQWVGSYGRQTSQIDALPGYRSVSATAVTYTGNGFDSSIFGGVIYNGSTASITVTGGPGDPGGTTKTLHAALDERPAFTSLAGVNYYRKTLVSAAIPSQSALPV